MTHLAGQRDSAAENSQLERLVAKSVGELAMIFAAAGRGFRGAAGEIDGALKIPVGIVNADIQYRASAS